MEVPEGLDVMWFGDELFLDGIGKHAKEVVKILVAEYKLASHLTMVMYKLVTVYSWYLVYMTTTVLIIIIINYLYPLFAFM